MNIDVALFLLELKTVRIGIVESVSVENNRCAEGASRLNLENWCRRGHADDGIDTEFLRSVGDPLCVIAR